MFKAKWHHSPADWPWKPIFQAFQALSRVYKHRHRSVPQANMNWAVFKASNVQYGMVDTQVMESDNQKGTTHKIINQQAAFNTAQLGIYAIKDGKEYNVVFHGNTTHQEMVPLTNNGC